jgi:phosphate butyryltransferase
MLKNFRELENLARKKGRKTIVVPSPESPSILEGLKMSLDFVKPILVGNSSEIKKLLDKIPLDGVEIISAHSGEEALTLALHLVKTGSADLLMKGKMITPDFLRGVLHRERGLRAEGILSHVAVHEISTYPKLLWLTDAGVNPHPNWEKRVGILRNAIDALHKLGYNSPKVALLASVETVHPELPETMEAAAFAKMAERGGFGDVLMDGPLAFDIAISREAAQLKGIESEVAGDVDLLVVPDVTTGNVLSKALIYLAGAKVGGVVLGALVPIVLLSRADTPERKYYSIVLAVSLA